MSSYPPVRGGAGGQSFTLGPEQNIFSGADRAAAEASRDAYAGANPGWLAVYDDPVNQGFLNIRLDYAEAGDPVAQYQTRDGVDWRDNQSAIGVKGDEGPAGATGNSYFFKSIAARDEFFSTGTNSQLLENGLPCTVNDQSEEAVYSYSWEGMDAPATYDPSFWRAASLGTKPGSLYLGEGGSRLSAGNRVLNFTDPEGDEYFFPASLFNSSGTDRPFCITLANEQTAILNSVSDQTLASPQSLAFGGAIAPSRTSAFVVIPKASGNLRVRSFYGSDDTGPVIVDNDYTIQPSDVDNPTTLVIPNPLLIAPGDQQFVLFEGVDLAGGLQTTGPFTGQVVIYLESTFALGDVKTLATEDQLPLPPAYGDMWNDLDSEIDDISIYRPWIEATDDTSDGQYVVANYDGINPANFTIGLNGDGLYQVFAHTSIDCFGSCTVDMRVFVNNLAQTVGGVTNVSFLSGDQSVAALGILPLTQNDVLTLEFASVTGASEDIDEIFTHFHIHRIAGLPASFDPENRKEFKLSDDFKQRFMRRKQNQQSAIKDYLRKINDAG